MWQTLLEAGMRYGEMRSVLWEDLDEERAIIRRHADETKSGKDRVIPLRRELLAEIQDLRAHHWRVTHTRLRKRSWRGRKGRWTSSHPAGP